MPATPALLEAILTRRSTKSLSEPAPTAAELDLLLRAAVTAPDHGSLQPWKFVFIAGDARERFGDALAASVVAAKPDAPEALVEKARAKAFAAPSCIVLIGAPKPGSKVDEWEQIASASSTGFAIALAAHTLGLGAMWKSAAFPPGPELRELLGLEDTDQLLGWVNLGRTSPGDTPRARPEVDLGALASVLGPDGRVPYAAS